MLTKIHGESNFVYVLCTGHARVLLWGVGMRCGGEDVCACAKSIDEEGKTSTSVCAEGGFSLVAAKWGTGSVRRVEGEKGREEEEGTYSSNGIEFIAKLFSDALHPEATKGFLHLVLFGTTVGKDALAGLEFELGTFSRIRRSTATV